MRPKSSRAEGMRMMTIALRTGAMTATAAGSPNQPVPTLIAAAVDPQAYIPTIRALRG